MTANTTESASTANARSRMATVEELALVYGVTMDPATDAANAGLRAAVTAHVVAREAWDAANEDGGDSARRNANRVVSVVDLTAGVVSSVACGLHGVTRECRPFQVVSTNHGQDDLRGVEYLSSLPSTGRAREVEGPMVIDVVRFFPATEEGAADAKALANRMNAGLV